MYLSSEYLCLIEFMNRILATHAVRLIVRNLFIYHLNLFEHCFFL